ncbi:MULTISPECIES: bacterioferritin [Anaeromyxobacter]|uniref:bacterioferritin n=1 Tax=Anaeromyxobacter TaxID=161492 RepID=UPI001F5ABE95|nr:MULTISPECIES: bacterioferritin [unclassified Anaeromyxobacter]
MQGDPKVIGLLNDLLSGELTAVHQYMLHARICQNWGYARLFEKIHHESRDELNHADELIARILYLDGAPDVQRLGTVAAGSSVHEQLKLDHALERNVRDALNSGIERCREAGDNGTAELLERLLEETEGHHHWLETQLAAIEQIGISGYLAEQLKGDGGS